VSTLIADDAANIGRHVQTLFDIDAGCGHSLPSSTLKTLASWS